MPEHLHDGNDIKLMRDMRKLAPDDFDAWLGLEKIVGRENGAIRSARRWLRRDKTRFAATHLLSSVELLRRFFDRQYRSWNQTI